ncbi:MAG: restriction endonuclease [Ruminococcaceae bacterium]|nr:restriction endonuclease [Oscillospiraceae bacterium]
MGDLTVNKDDRKLVELINSGKEGIGIIKPFERDIFLFDTHVAGTTHIVGIEDIEPHLNIGEKLHFFREPDNMHDEAAILVMTKNEVKIGYVPKKDNIIFSRLMDAGKILFGRISEKEMRGKWLRIKMEIYLHE